MLILSVLLISVSYIHPSAAEPPPNVQSQCQIPVLIEKDHLSKPFAGPTWSEKYGIQVDQPFSGPLSFSHLPYVQCLDNASVDFDITILGLPFDTAVSYRPG